ncbi:hypothetical protein DM01DRAFT_1338601 [Hesseltinella vesiculosa]|uniref:Uncharacterized protein n=1 Tax=Hesseltinella vesiculosa TaxID=101127 RepID=A0A1X2GAR0_9FUNG|nr:hypothetical protein DM01DRAFT_1338601 [Hesseltinella vesiculosa]
MLFTHSFQYYHPGLRIQLLILSVVSMILYLVGLIYAGYLHQKRKRAFEKRTLRALMLIFAVGFLGRIMSAVNASTVVESGKSVILSDIPELLFVPFAEVAAMDFPIMVVHACVATNTSWYASKWGWLFVLSYLMGIAIYGWSGIYNATLVVSEDRYMIFNDGPPGSLWIKGLVGALSGWFVLAYLAIIAGFYKRLHPSYFVCIGLVMLYAVTDAVFSVPSEAVFVNLKRNYGVDTVYNLFTMLPVPLALILAAHTSSTWIDRTLPPELVAYQQVTSQEEQLCLQQEYRQKWEAFHNWEQQQKQLPQPSPKQEMPQPGQPSSSSITPQSPIFQKMEAQPHPKLELQHPQDPSTQV